MADDGPVYEAPLSAGPPPLFDVTAFSQWVTDVFTEDHDDEILDKLASMDASDDMAKMRLLLGEEAEMRRSRMEGEAITKTLKATGVFPDMLIQMSAMGEEAGERGGE